MKRGPNSRSLKERLDHKSVQDPSGCRVWTASTDGRFGYGKLSWRGRMQYAHRLAWEVERGPIPDGLVCRHQCGRAVRAKGAGHALAKLDEVGVADIRRRYALGESQSSLGREYGLSQAGISRIVRNISYTTNTARS